MKHSILILMVISLLNTTTGFSQQKDIEKIEETILAFAKAGDQNDYNTLATYLDENYRLVMNRLFGNDNVSIIPKTVYLQKIKSKVFGGDSRIVTIHEVLINGTSATAKVTLKGQKMTFTSLMTLIMDKSYQWKLISDIPFVVRKD